MTIVSSGASLSSGRIGNGGNKDSCRKDEQTIDFRRAYFHAIMMPVHVDTASASAVAAKNIFVGSELVAAWTAMLALALGSQVSDHPALPMRLGRIGWSNFRGVR